MGMCMVLTSLGDANIERVLADPPLIWRVVAPDEPELYDDECAARAGLFARLLRRKPAQKQLQLARGEGQVADLDKAWHGIHYLLCGKAGDGAWPHGFLLGGGRTVGDVEVGYGPARVLAAAETQRVRDMLAGLDDGQLRARFDGEAMTAQRVYPEIWSRPLADGEDPVGYLLDNVTTLRGFLDGAVREGLGAVLALT